MAKPKPKKPTVPQIADLIARPAAESTGARRGSIPRMPQRTMSASLPAANTGRPNIPLALPQDQPGFAERTSPKGVVRGTMEALANIPGLGDAVSLGIAGAEAARGKAGGAIAYGLAGLPLIGPAGGKAATKALSRVTEWSQPHAAEMARIYEGLPAMQPEARSAYEQMAREVDDQFERMKQAGIKVEFTDADPYKTSKEMMEDVKAGRLKVFRTAEDFGHPFLTREQNDKFRAVHDYFGHAGEGHQFGPKGEENAFRVHSEMFSPEARRAMATETRGQNSWVNAGPHAHLPPAQRPFAQQKGALWPEEWLGEYPDLPKSPEAKLGGAADLVAERRQLRDRTAQEIRQRRKIEREASVNPLTGVGNRRAFEQARARVDADPNLEWASLDVNHLKATNDKLGHEAGDTLLKRAAQTLREQPGVQQVFHHGGDEMAIVTRKGEAQRVVDEVGKMDILPSFTHNGRTIRPSISGHVGATYSEADAGVQAVKQARKQSERAAALASEPAPVYGGFDKPGPKKETLWDIAKKVISNERGSIKAVPDKFPGKKAKPVLEAPTVVTPSRTGTFFDEKALGVSVDPNAARWPQFEPKRADLSVLEKVLENIRTKYTPAVKQSLRDSPAQQHWYDIRQLRDAAADRGASPASFERWTNFLGPTSQGTLVKANLKRATYYNQLAEQGLLTPEALLGRMDIAPGYASRWQKGVNSGLYKIMYGGGLDPLTDPKTTRYTGNFRGVPGIAVDEMVGRRIGLPGKSRVKDPKTGEMTLVDAVGFPTAGYEKTGIVQSAPPNTHYPTIENAMAAEAGKMGMPDFGYQAAGWPGTDTRPFISHVNEQIANTANAYKLTPMQVFDELFVRPTGRVLPK